MAHSDKLPQGWIATGNVFSHLEDHANALKCFKRAIQCNPDFAYSHTLAGHECITLEEWETALGFFRDAVRKQPQHYNAWFGIGNVYMRTGKYRMAEYHFRRAAEINPSNSMLLCCVGSVLEKLNRRQEALEMYERACLHSPTSPAVRFKRVRVLMELKQYDVGPLRYVGYVSADVNYFRNTVGTARPADRPRASARRIQRPLSAWQAVCCARRQHQHDTKPDLRTRSRAALCRSNTGHHRARKQQSSINICHLFGQ